MDLEIVKHLKLPPQKVIKELHQLLSQRVGLDVNWSLKQVSEELLAGGCVVAYFKKSLIAGLIFRNIDKNVKEVTLMGTHQDHQKNQVMTQVWQEFLTLKTSEIWLEVAENNSKAINFYKKMGFVKSGQRDNYYKNRCSALLMSYTVEG